MVYHDEKIETVRNYIDRSGKYEVIHDFQRFAANTTGGCRTA